MRNFREVVLTIWVTLIVFKVVFGFPNTLNRANHIQTSVRTCASKEFVPTVVASGKLIDKNGQAYYYERVECLEKK